MCKTRPDARLLVGRSVGDMVRMGAQESDISPWVLGALTFRYSVHHA